MHTLWIAFAGVALAELGDKTQLLSLVLAARYRRPWPIVLGILVATLVNHALAALAGAWLGTLLTPTLQRWLVGISLLVVATWTLKPDHIDADEGSPALARGVFVATTLAFFLAEMGDKTQIATLILGADLHPYWQVVAGSTLGMLVVNVPTVWLGARYAQRIPLKLTRTLAALLFAALGLWVLLR
ncbi:MAG: TMEM165/GDT1 family protein [Metallibacterium sp.]